MLSMWADSKFQPFHWNPTACFGSPSSELPQLMQLRFRMLINRADAQIQSGPLHRMPSWSSGRM
jgi:hypothetical protein